MKKVTSAKCFIEKIRERKLKRKINNNVNMMIAVIERAFEIIIDNPDTDANQFICEAAFIHFAELPENILAIEKVRSIYKKAGWHLKQLRKEDYLVFTITIATSL